MGCLISKWTNLNFVKRERVLKLFDDLVKFLEYVKNNCNYGYGCAPRALAQATLATAWYLCSEFGLTGFQAGFVMWDFIIDWMYTCNKCGLRIIDYDNMLYPQYKYRFEKTISHTTWKSIQEQAKKNLEEVPHNEVCDSVAAHWKSIVDGNVPFGYIVRDD